MSFFKKKTINSVLKSSIKQFNDITNLPTVSEKTEALLTLKEENNKNIDNLIKREDIKAVGRFILLMIPTFLFATAALTSPTISLIAVGFGSLALGNLYIADKKRTQAYKANKTIENKINNTVLRFLENRSQEVRSSPKFQQTSLQVFNSASYKTKEIDKAFIKLDKKLEIESSAKVLNNNPS